MTSQHIEGGNLFRLSGERQFKKAPIFSDSYLPTWNCVRCGRTGLSGTVKSCTGTVMVAKGGMLVPAKCDSPQSTI